MEDYLLSWSSFLLRNRDAVVNGKTYKKHGHQWILELYNQWINNSDIGKIIKSYK